MMNSWIKANRNKWQHILGDTIEIQEIGSKYRLKYGGLRGDGYSYEFNTRSSAEKYAKEYMKKKDVILRKAFGRIR